MIVNEELVLRVLSIIAIVIVFGVACSLSAPTGYKDNKGKDEKQ